MQLSLGSIKESTFLPFVKINIPTKRYLKAFLQNRFGEELLLSHHDPYGKCLYVLLSDNRKRKDMQPISGDYKEEMNVSLHRDAFRHYGFSISKTGVRAFNTFVEELFKEMVHSYIDGRLEVKPKLKDAIADMRIYFKIDDDDWDYESIKKDYYRYRKRNGKALLYEK